MIDLSCSFCGRSFTESQHLIKGLTIRGLTTYICGQCVAKCQEVIDKTRG